MNDAKFDMFLRRLSELWFYLLKYQFPCIDIWKMKMDKLDVNSGCMKARLMG